MMPALPTVVFGERRNALGNVRRSLAKQVLGRISGMSLITTDSVDSHSLENILALFVF